MSVSFSVLLQGNNDMNKLLQASTQFFDIDYLRESQNAYTLIDKDDSYVIRISNQRLKFIISEVEEEQIDKKVKLVEEFLANNFKNETVRVRCYDDYCLNMNNISEVKVINLQ